MDNPAKPMEAVKAVEAHVDGRLSTADLMERYGFKSRSTLTNRLEALGIKPYKDNQVYYVPMDAVEQLNQLHDCLKVSGAKLDECAKQIKYQHDSMTPNGTSAHIDRASQFLEILASQREPLQIQLVPTLQPPDPLASFRSLNEAAAEGWALPTSTLLPLLGLKSIPRLQNGTFCRRGFVFRRCLSNGRESEWQIGKLT